MKRGKARQPLLSVILCNGSASGGMADTVSALAAQTFDDFEIILPRRGQTQRMNARISGRYVCCLDVGAKPAPTFVEICLFLLENSSCQAVVPETVAGPPAWIVCRRDAIIGHPHVWPHLGESASRGAWRRWLALSASGARIRTLQADGLFGAVAVSGQAPPPGLAAQFRRNRPPIRRPRFERGPSLAKWTRGSGRSLLLAVPFFAVGGSERLTSGVIRMLAGNGWQISVVSSLPLHAGVCEGIGWFQQVTDSVFPMSGLLRADECDAFFDHIVRSRGVHVLWLSGSRYAYDRLAWLRHHFPKLSVADILYNPIGHIEPNRAHAAHIDVTITETAHMVGVLRDMGESAERLHLIPSGVAIDLVNRRPRDVMRRELGLPDDSVVVGFMGRISSEKAPDVFVEMAAMLRGKPKLHFVMCGDGPMRRAIEESIQTLSLERFLYLGEVEDPASHMAAFDVLVLPSRMDGSPMVVREAMSLGVAVVASALDGVVEMIADGVTGRLAPPADAAALAEAVGALVEDRSALKRVKAAARRHAETHFQSERMMAAYLSLFASLCRGDAQ